MRRLLILVALGSSGCFARVQAGYQLDVPVTNPGGAHVEVSDGAGDFREKPWGAVPSFWSVDLVGERDPESTFAREAAARLAALPARVTT